MSLSSEHGISSGDLNTGGNLSESSFLEALFGLELGHADDADDADLSSLLFISPTDFTEFHRFLPYAGWDFTRNLQISCYFLGGFEKKAYFCGRLQSKNLKGELLWIHWIKNFGKNVKLL